MGFNMSKQTEIYWFPSHTFSGGGTQRLILLCLDLTVIYGEAEPIAEFFKGQGHSPLLILMSRQRGG